MIVFKILSIVVLNSSLISSAVAGISDDKVTENLPNLTERDQLIAKKKKKNQECIEVWLCKKDNRRPGLTTSISPEKPKVGKCFDPHLKKRFFIPFLLISWILKSVFLNRFFITLKVPASLGVTEWHLISCEVKLMELILIC